MPIHQALMEKVKQEHGKGKGTGKGTGPDNNAVNQLEAQRGVPK